MDPAVFYNALVSYGPPGLAAAFFLYKWQQAENRIEKLRDAFELKTKEYYETILATQKAGFDNSLRVEGVLTNASQTIASNTVVLQAIVHRGS